MNIDERIAENVARVRQNVADAASSAGRTPSEVTIVAVTKYVNADLTRELAEAGLLDLGENRPQQLWTKADELHDLQIRWHQIGHLQRNKAKRTCQVAALIHSVDSLRLAKAMSEIAEAQEKPLDVLLEVNISGDEAKHGFQPVEMESAVEQINLLPGVHIRGLMAMASLHGDTSAARTDFANLRILRNDLQKVVSNEVCLDELSMGMSRDYREAIEEGATIVRIGSAFFDGVDLDSHR